MYKLISFLYERLKFRVGNYAFNDQKKIKIRMYMETCILRYCYSKSWDELSFNLKIKIFSFS